MGYETGTLVEGGVDKATNGPVSIKSSLPALPHRMCQPTFFCIPFVAGFDLPASGRSLFLIAAEARIHRTQLVWGKGG